MSASSEPVQSVRIDLWLWAVRIFKTRSQAAQACRKGQVTVDGRDVKPARLVRSGDEIHVKRHLLTAHYRVLGTLERRVGAEAAKEFCRDLTPPEVIEQAREIARQNRGGPKRASGKGRPTKRERRELDALTDEEQRGELFERLVDRLEREK